MRWLPFALRDLTILAVTAALWGLIGGDEPPIPLAVARGTLVAVSGFLLHEWGHLLGARASGAVVESPSRWLSVFLFRFDVSKGTRSQFLWLSYGGYAATVVGVLVVLAIAPFDRLDGQVALGLTVVGMIATFALELPTTVRVARGGPLPTGFAYAGTPEEPPAGDR